MRLKNTLSVILAGGTVAGTLALSGAAQAAQPEAKFYGLLDVWAGSVESPAADDDTKQLGAGGMSTSFLGARVDYQLDEETSFMGVAEMFSQPMLTEVSQSPASLRTVEYFVISELNLSRS